MAPSVEAIHAALATVNDPEINRPLPDLGMVKSVDVAADGSVDIGVYLTVTGCPMRDTITERVSTAVGTVPGVTSVRVSLDVMDDEQRAELRRTLRGEEKPNPFADPTSLTKVIAVASGKGGVGKSSVTANLAVAMEIGRAHV